ncbi:MULTISPECIES: M48 family metallopeptidase [unclassified Novosphingobium]|uniref:M48 family metallopeptidase n=1 Tax=unclassified Novosphingobium TaxID=2644732 RepID=UPI0025E1ECF1|nr:MULTISPECIES: SprT family zinc-dependent metalloprotease [unclassified Novosphingobium]HQS70438.1 SprT family zinc-dependent metalloprotease [Novosphingobium sp.]
MGEGRGMLDWLRLADPKAKEALVPRAASPRTVSRRTIVVADRELPLVIRKLGHARRMTLRLAPDGSEARVSMPAWGRVGDAEAFARDRADWLAGQLARLPEAAAIAPDATIMLRGETLRIDWQPAARRKPAVVDGCVVVGGPAEGLATRLQRWLEAEALALCADDLAHYCARAGETMPRLSLSRAQRRWGSCASDGAIRINWRLIMAPDFVRRSVVAHEVAHMRHFDHSPAFHAHLERLFEGEVDAANRWLKRYGRTLYAPFG